MIASSPVAATADVPTVLGKIDAFIAAAKLSAAGGITWSEFGELLLAFIRVAVESLDVLKAVPGAEKKVFVLEGVARLFDAVADRCVPMVVWPVWGLVRSPVRSLVLALASGAIEQVLSLVRLA